MRHRQYTTRPPLFGFADLHNHHFAHLAFGANGLITGNPSGPADVALKACKTLHNPGDVMERYHPIRCTNYAGHPTGGWPKFDGWPRWNTFTHQMNYETWLRRAHIGGLRLMVMLAVNSEPSCEKMPGSTPAPGRTCEDMENVRVQLRAAKAFELSIDRKFGAPPTGECDVAGLDCDAVYHGDRPGWYRIVYSAEQARETIAAGKLAVVLGIEVADLFGCVRSGSCSKGSISADVGKLRRLGVRHVFPLHNAANTFGGPAIFNNGQCQSIQGSTCSVDVGAIRKCRGEGYLYERRYHGGGSPVCGASTGSVHCSDVGLTDLGAHLVSTLMNRQFIIDVDHMSAYARRDTLAIANAQTDGVYPLVSGHTDFFDLSAGEGKSEATLKSEEVGQIFDSGGIVAPIVGQGEPDAPCAAGSTLAICREPQVIHTCTKDVSWSSSAEFARAYVYAKNLYDGPSPRVALGSDFNGMLTLPRPRFGPDGCFDLTRDGDRVGRVTYPFAIPIPVAATPAAPRCDTENTCACVNDKDELLACTFGERTFDVNTDGLPHVGLLPDFLEDVRVQFAARFRAIGYSSSDAQTLATTELEPMFRSAEAYVLMWERIDKVTVRASSDALEPNDTPETATPSTALAANPALTLHTPEDVDHYEVTISGCGTLQVVLTHDPNVTAPDLEVRDAVGAKIRATWVTSADRTEATIPRAGGKYTVVVSHASPTICRNTFDCRPELQEYTGTYRLSITVAADSTSGPEVCDGVDNDCNGAVDDCVATDPACRDIDNDGRANCLDEDDDNDCVLDGQDNCPEHVNANSLCPQANKGHACARCAKPLLQGVVERLGRWVEACAFHPVDRQCQLRPCGLDGVFGGLAPRVATLRALLADPKAGVLADADRRVLNGAFGTMRFNGSTVSLPPAGARTGAMALECASGPAAEAAGRAIAAIEEMYRQCVRDDAAYVHSGKCQEMICRP